MGVRVSEQCRTLSAAELLGIGGFSFFIGWMLVSFYWLFCEFPPGLTIAERDLSQLFIFLGISVGYGLLTLLARRPSFTPFAASFVGAELVFSLALPLCAFALFQGIPISTTVASVINFLAGMAASGMVVSWLDVCSRL